MPYARPARNRTDLTKIAHEPNYKLIANWLCSARHDEAIVLSRHRSDKEDAPVRTVSKRAYARHHCAMTGFLSFRGHEPGFQCALIYFCIGRRDVSVLVAVAQDMNQIRNRCP